MEKSIINETPDLTKNIITNALWDRYRIKGSISFLPGERDLNARVDTETGKSYVFKIFNRLEDPEFIQAQHMVFNYLRSHRFPCPEVIRAIDNQDIVLIPDENGVGYLARLTPYIQGIPIAKAKFVTNAFYFKLGKHLGRLDRLLQEFDHPAMHRDFYWDLENGAEIIRQYLHLIEDTAITESITKFLSRYLINAKPLLPNLRKSIIHNDVNDYNILIKEQLRKNGLHQEISGIIDYGDMVYSYTVAELAIAIAYLFLELDDPLSSAAVVVQNYHQVNPLTDDEISVLFYFICLRLCMSICIAASQTRENPENPYLEISQKYIRDGLPKLFNIHPRFAEATFRIKCQLSPSPQVIQLNNPNDDQGEEWYPIVGEPFTQENCKYLDLGVKSSSVKFVLNSTGAKKHTFELILFKDSQEVKYLVGKHNEARLLPIPDRKNIEPFSRLIGGKIHLGIDIFTRQNQNIYAPLDGWVADFLPADTQANRFSGLLLGHNTHNGKIFYTLYRNINTNHLMVDQIEKPSLHGKAVNKGELLGITENVQLPGSEFAFLHFQLVTDPLYLGCKFPAFVPAKQKAIWLTFSPNPHHPLKLPNKTNQQHFKSKTITLEERKSYLGRNLSLAYHNPLKIERGWMQYLFDETGRRYLDGYNNVPHVGHCHPEVIEAGYQQMNLLNTNTRYLHDLINTFSEKLVATLPEPLRVCFFVNSGSEANELALRLARTYTGEKDLIVLEGAYHGNTTSMIDISPYKFNGPGGSGAPDWVYTVPLPDSYRGRYQENDIANKYARHIIDVVRSIKEAGKNICAFIAETCPSVGGQILLPDGYLGKVYEHIRSEGGVCIADEVQTGYGRLGTHFYGFEAQQVVPDILVLGKPIGNGHPIGVVITTNEIASSFDNGMEFFSTFGGNPVSCAIGLKVLEIVKKENLQKHAFEVGNFLLGGLRKIQKNHPLIGEVRGSGLFIGVEVVRDQITKKPAAKEAETIINTLRELGVLIGTDGIDNNVIKIRPPMPFSLEDATVLLNHLEYVLDRNYSR